GNRYKGQQRMAGGGSTIGSVISAGCPHSAYRSRRGRNRSPRDLGELTSPLVHGKHVRDGDSVVVGAWLASESSFSIVALTLGDRTRVRREAERVADGTESRPPLAMSQAWAWALAPSCASFFSLITFSAIGAGTSS